MKIVILFLFFINFLFSIEYEYLLENSYNKKTEKIKLEELDHQKAILKIKEDLKPIIVSKSIQMYENKLDKKDFIQIFNSMEIGKKVNYYSKINSVVKKNNQIIYDKNNEYFFPDFNNKFNINTYSLLNQMYENFDTVLSISCKSKVNNSNVPLIYSYVNARIPNECIFSFFSQIREEKKINIGETDGLNFFNVIFNDSSEINIGISYEKEKYVDMNLIIKNANILEDNVKFNRFASDILFDYFDSTLLEILKLELDSAKYRKDKRKILETTIENYYNHFFIKFSYKNMIKNKFFLNFPDNFKLIIMYSTN